MAAQDSTCSSTLAHTCSSTLAHTCSSTLAHTCSVVLTRVKYSSPFIVLEYNDFVTFVCHFCRSHNEVNWAQKLPYPVPIPVSTMEPKPDLVSVRLNIKRLESSPAVWQVNAYKH